MHPTLDIHLAREIMRDRHRHAADARRARLAVGGRPAPGATPSRPRGLRARLRLSAVVPGRS